KEHCIFGENNIKDYPLAGKNKNIVKYHHENWDRSGFFGLKEDEIPLLAQIIGLADFVDNVYHFEKERKKEIKDFIISNKGKRFSPQIAEAFLKVASHQKFWLDLKNEFIWIALKSHAVPNIKQLTWKEIFSITKVFVSIIDSKSRFTGRHSSGLIEKTKIACDFYNFDETTTQKMLIAASLHDLGKLAVSSDILEKPAKLNAAEINVMKAHTYYTKIALSQIEHFDEIKNWSANHHEKLNGNGYPEGLAADRLCFNSRLLACLDIFQALTENRPYRKGMKFEDAFAIMKKLAKQNDIDAEIVNGFIPQLKNIAF
ncbi:MAG: HD family phosphohydrolase, partial [Candidatus Cloacimonadota bacterium]